MERNLGKRGKIIDENGEKFTSRIGLNENDIEVQCGRHRRRVPLIIYNVNKNYHVRIRVLQKDRRQFCLQGDVSSTRCLSKNVPTLANFSFDKHELISIILAAKQHRPTLKYNMPIQHSLSNFYFVCF